MTLPLASASGGRAAPLGSNPATRALLSRRGGWFPRSQGPASETRPSAAARREGNHGPPLRRLARPRRTRPPPAPRAPRLALPAPGPRDDYFGPRPWAVGSRG